LYNQGTRRPLNEYDIEIIRPYASHTALAIRAAQDRRRIENNRIELRLLNDIILHMTESTERDNLLNGVVSKAKQVLLADFCGVFLSDYPPKILMPPDAKYSLRASDGLNISHSDTIFCQIGKGPIGKAINTGNIVENDMKKDSAELDECAEKLMAILNASSAIFRMSAEGSPQCCNRCADFY